MFKVCAGEVLNCNTDKTSLTDRAETGLLGLPDLALHGIELFLLNIVALTLSGDHRT